MDSDGEALRRWGIYAFPTTLVLTGSTGSAMRCSGKCLRWDSAEVIDTLEPY